ncbi:MAG: (2Fe-2S)-binding protein [Terrisporobacter sp.]|uniref:(2Fe-2S)-binding protein n=1 Tax=Terrisporobacter sp. TaxID=1965305 RepID=UPI002FC79191
MIKKLVDKYKEYKKIKESTPQKVCKCYNVSNHDIKNAIENGCTGISHVRSVTKAGTACGKCNSSVESIVYKAIKKQDSK